MSFLQLIFFFLTQKWTLFFFFFQVDSRGGRDWGDGLRFGWERRKCQLEFHGEIWLQDEQMDHGHCDELQTVVRRSSRPRMLWTRKSHQQWQTFGIDNGQRNKTVKKMKFLYYHHFVIYTFKRPNIYPWLWESPREHCNALVSQCIMNMSTYNLMSMHWEQTRH